MMKNENIFHSLAHQQKAQNTQQKYIFFIVVPFILPISLNRRYSTGGTTNIGETNRIYIHIININAILLTSCLTLQVRTMIHQQHHFLQD